MDNMIRMLTAAAIIAFAATPAIASDPAQMPEPGILGLLIAGGIVGVIITLRNRRK